MRESVRQEIWHFLKNLSSNRFQPAVIPGSFLSRTLKKGRSMNRILRRSIQDAAANTSGTQSNA